MRLVMGFAAIVALVFSSNTLAEFDTSKAYVGGGLASNSLDGSGFDSAIGFQGFAGYDITDLVPIDEKIGLSVEAGYATSGNFKFKACNTGLFGSICDISSDGLWSTAVFDYKIKDKIKAIGRIGFDLADSSGVIFGVGGRYQLNTNMDVAVEYVIRDIYKGLQANFIYYLK